MEARQLESLAVGPATLMLLPGLPSAAAAAGSAASAAAAMAGAVWAGPEAAASSPAALITMRSAWPPASWIGSSNPYSLTSRGVNMKRRVALPNAGINPCPAPANRSTCKQGPHEHLM